ncbi:hypothetical protein ACTPD5_22210, partial [Clostridioides difficile]
KTKDEIFVYAVEKEIEETIKKVHRIIADESSPEQCLRKIMLNPLASFIFIISHFMSKDDKITLFTFSSITFNSSFDIASK